MTRRRFMALLAAPYISGFDAVFQSFLTWRLHVVGRARCQNGPVIYLVVQGKQYNLTELEREYLESVADGLARLEAPNLNCTVEP